MALTHQGRETRWSVRQAGYQLRSTQLGASEHGSFVQHFVVTRHGVVARTWIGPDFVQIVLRRPANSGGTYQGSVRAVPGGWQAFDDFTGAAQPVGPVYADYLDAEAPLLRRRTGHRATSAYGWPAEHLRLITARRAGARAGER
jgi:hypothetical protein